MKRSIRWSLLGSYALTLLAVLGFLGGTLYRQRRTSMEDAVRGELLAHARAIAGAVEWDEDGFELELDPAYLGRFRGTDEDAPYFEVRGADGEMLYTPEAGMDAPPVAMMKLPMPREVVRVDGPRGSSVWVRRGTRAMQRDLSAFGREVFLISLGGFVLALLAGLGLVRRVLKPLSRITDTASRISASNPDERIDVERMEKELGSLATTLNGAFDRLQGAVDRQVRFTADASHDLRTPLAVLKANLEWALRGDREPSETREVLSACLRATDRMGHTVEGLLTLARNDATASSLRDDDVDLRSVAKEVIDFVRPAADAARVELALDGEPARVRGDADRLGECLTALMDNALHHTPVGGRVEIRTSVASDEAVLEVSDSGAGIADEDLPHLFERFYRADTARRGGNGLGLAIAWQHVKAHGGTLEAGNRPTGGAVFRVRLPASQ